MEIRFCTVCNESIPDGEFDAGRAIVSGKHSQHVACALRRSVVMSGTRSWLTFFLALFAAGTAAFLLVAHLNRDEGPPVILEVPAVVTAHVDAQLRGSEKRQGALVEKAIGDHDASMSADFEGRLTGLLEGKVKDRLKAQDDLLRQSDEGLDGRIRDLDRLLRKQQAMLAAVLDWKQRIQDEADQLRKDLEDAKKRQPPEPVAVARPDVPEGGEPDAPGLDKAREEEIDRWIKRLRDPDEDIVFSATIELARLKALRATPDLVRVLTKHKDFYARLGAATALGEIRSVDAVPDLIEALSDKDDLVRTAAAEALHLITDQDFNFVTGLSKSERVRIQKKWRGWWRDNEDDVRIRWGQPSTK